VRPPQRYDVLVATGGLGSGIHLALEGDHTLGREESRGAYLLDRRDFGKLHIISHYVQTLLDGEVLVVPVGRVGDDSAGEGVKHDLQRVGVDLSHITTDREIPTLFSVCFAYPSGEGGNLTTLNSASGSVTEDAVAATESLFERFEHRGIAVVAPEVPLSARATLLRLATTYDFLRAGSLVAGELRHAVFASLIGSLDLLAVNLQEAAALAGLPPEAAPSEIVAAAVGAARALNEEIQLVITAGRSGSWVWDGIDLSHDGGIPAQVVNAAGAGDAHFAGVLVALASGLAIQEANAFATVVSALKVAGTDTIAWDIDPVSVEKAAAEFQRPLPSRLRERLEDRRRPALPLTPD
jgi:sugar/nucleoside kinase (ribokinase family)